MSLTVVQVWYVTIGRPGVFVSLTVVQVWYVTIGRPGVVCVTVFLYCLFVHVCCIKCNMSWVWYD